MQGKTDHAGAGNAGNAEEEWPPMQRERVPCREGGENGSPSFFYTRSLEPRSPPLPDASTVPSPPSREPLFREGCHGASGVPDRLCSFHFCFYLLFFFSSFLFFFFFSSSLSLLFSLFSPPLIPLFSCIEVKRIHAAPGMEKEKEEREGKKKKKKKRRRRRKTCSPFFIKKKKKKKKEKKKILSPPFFLTKVVRRWYPLRSVALFLFSYFLLPWCWTSYWPWFQCVKFLFFSFYLCPQEYNHGLGGSGPGCYFLLPLAPQRIWCFGCHTRSGALSK